MPLLRFDSTYNIVSVLWHEKHSILVPESAASIFYRSLSLSSWRYQKATRGILYTCAISVLCRPYTTSHRIFVYCHVHHICRIKEENSVCAVVVVVIDNHIFFILYARGICTGTCSRCHRVAIAALVVLYVLDWWKDTNVYKPIWVCSYSKCTNTSIHNFWPKVHEHFITSRIQEIVFVCACRHIQ